jgi:fluoride ion exporter CrcB/FEX
MEILREYIALCWLSNEPLELPRSVGLFRKNLLLYFVIGYLLQANMIDDPFESFYEITLQIILMLGFLALMLSLNKTLYVYVQIATAFILSANIISAFVIPVMVWLTVNEDIYSYYMMFLLIAWYFSIVTYIIKHTLVVNLLASMILALFYFIFTYLGAFAIGQLI